MQKRIVDWCLSKDIFWENFSWNVQGSLISCTSCSLSLQKYSVYSSESAFIIQEQKKVLTFSWAFTKPFKGKEKENGSTQVQLDGWIICSDISQKAAVSKTFFYKTNLSIGHFSLIDCFVFMG